MKRIAFIVAAAAAAISLFLLASATSNADMFADSYPYLLALNGFIAVALAGVVGVQVRRLLSDRRRKVFGSRLKFRLLTFFALMAIVPGVLIYTVSLQFVVRSIETWFDVRVDAALEGGIALGQTSLDYLGRQLQDHADDMALSLSESPALAASRLNRLREQAGVDSATLFSAGGRIHATASNSVSSFLPNLPSNDQLRQARNGQRSLFIDADPDGRIELRVIVPVPHRSIADEATYLQLIQPVPESMSRHANAVQSAYRDYQQLSLGRDGLKRIYSLTLTLSLLLALLAATAVAFVLARKLTKPLIILAQGTEAVAQGDFSPRRALPAHDELGVLTQSFNQMTRQLDEARALAERNRAAVEAARSYLESVLANLSAGVLAFSADGTLRAANRGATEILDDPLDGYEDITLADWPAHPDLRDALVAALADNQSDWHQQVEVRSPDGGEQTLLIHGATLPQAAGGGTVVVFDDISHLIAAERTAAWAEVARRLAHEIKNPLTPIQLSAERLAMKLAPRLDDDGRAMLERATGTIVTQVEAMKNLVNAFRDYARLPAPVLAPLDLNHLVHEVLGLYDGARVRIDCELAPALPRVLGDAAQLRQVIHNLLQNAEDALADQADGRILIATTERDKDRIRLSVRDNGHGFPADMLGRAFEPYFTTKARGTGLGLAIVKKIIDEHGGEIRLINHEDGGADVRIHLRAARTEAS
ncbi:sensor histidine kinase [Denitromonas iodatirespirans]|uniref:histidine kinase n=1 Tax=Denitromonas iodatirespirans TaxID=2795389 RepID=A0A944D8N6_DENI1|nr:ATP-binding protein [Denitromonas iodatirespirans]MBT0959957.1 HAMP domain-containing protein [Denitromonas iodatirespirans]